MSIKHLAEDDRPREKFLMKGKNALSDSELLGIIMGSGSRSESAVDLARRILDSVEGSWHALSRLNLSNLMKFKGIGEAKAIAISAALEIGRRRAAQEVPEKMIIKNSEQAYSLLAPYLSDLQVEEFWAILLNQSGRVLYKGCLTSGGIAGTVVDVRVLFRLALDHSATALMIAHNHPSGSTAPSAEDKSITHTVAKAGDILSIRLLDHLIISQHSYYSFSDSGLL